MSAPKSDTATIEARKNRLLELLTEGKSQTEAAEILRREDYPASLRTVQEDIRKLRVHWQETNKETFAESVANQVELHLRVIEELWTGIMPSETGNAIKGHLDSIARLTGRNAPEKSVRASVNVDQQVIPIEQQLEYLNAFAGLYDDERLEELDRVKARKRTCRVVMDASWGQKELPGSGL